MRTIIVAASLLAISSTAAPAQTVTYRFRGLVEHAGDAPDAKPLGYGTVVPIAITVDTSVSGNVSGDEALYGDTAFYPQNMDPIISVKIGSTVFTPSAYDTISIRQAAQGPSSLVVTQYDLMRGACTFTFTAARGTGSTSLAIPAQIYTLQYDTATFSCNYPQANVAGDMTSLAIPPLPSAAGAVQPQ